jgi:hypothetical protein
MVSILMLLAIRNCFVYVHKCIHIGASDKCIEKALAIDEDKRENDLLQLYDE